MQKQLTAALSKNAEEKLKLNDQIRQCNNLSDMESRRRSNIETDWNSGFLEKQHDFFIQNPEMLKNAAAAVSAAALAAKTEEDNELVNHLKKQISRLVDELGRVTDIAHQQRTLIQCYHEEFSVHVDSPSRALTTLRSELKKIHEQHVDDPLNEQAADVASRLELFVTGLIDREASVQARETRIRNALSNLALEQDHEAAKNMLTSFATNRSVSHNIANGARTAGTTTPVTSSLLPTRGPSPNVAQSRQPSQLQQLLATEDLLYDSYSGSVDSHKQQTMTATTAKQNKKKQQTASVIMTPTSLQDLASGDNNKNGKSPLEALADDTY